MYFADAHAALTDFNVLFSIVATLSAVVLGFLSAKNKITIVALEESNKAYASLHETDKLTLDANKDQIKILNQKANILENHITQAPDINELAVQLATQHKEMMNINKETMKAIQGMTKELSNVAKAVVNDAS